LYVIQMSSKLNMILYDMMIYCHWWPAGCVVACWKYFLLSIFCFLWCRMKILVGLIVLCSYAQYCTSHAQYRLNSYKEHNSTICVYSGKVNAATRHRANYPQYAYQAWTPVNVCYELAWKSSLLLDHCRHSVPADSRSKQMPTQTPNLCAAFIG